MQKSFAGTSNLKRHQRTVHESEKPCKCKICQKSFGDKGDLNRHQTTVHENKNCNIIEFLINKVLDVKPLVPYLSKIMPIV